MRNRNSRQVHRRARLAAGRWASAMVALLLSTIIALYVQPAIAAPEEVLTPEEARSGSLLLRMRSGYQVATRVNTIVDLVMCCLTVRAIVRQTVRMD